MICQIGYTDGLEEMVREGKNRKDSEEKKINFIFII